MRRAALIHVHKGWTVMLRHLLLSVHGLAAIVWLGGMFFAYVCLRPAAASVLQPPQRLPLWTAVLSRFLPCVAVAIVLLLASGTVLLQRVGIKSAPVGWHVMVTLGLVMSAVFAAIYFRWFPQLRAHCARQAWPEAALALNAIRRAVGINLILGTVVVLAAMSAH